MRVYTSDDHRRHHSLELDRGRLIASWECPERIDALTEALQGHHEFCAPGPVDLGLVSRVHDPAYIDFLRTAWDRWQADGQTGPAAMGFCWPARRMNHERLPRSLNGRLGYYGFSADSSIMADTWGAVRASVALAQSATRAVIDGDRAAFAMCRPPGHHATRDQFGGYCYINNAAVAAQQLRDSGSSRVAVVDIDYHHGNGTQDIFYDRNDVLYCSIHGDPYDEFPYFVGHADERGDGGGDGFNHNEPLPAGTDYSSWSAALERCLDRVVDTACDALVVSLGVDTFEGDPISHFRLTTADYPKIGSRLAELGLPTVLIFEGGYAVAEVGHNVNGVLAGFEAGSPAATA